MHSGGLFSNYCIDSLAQKVIFSTDEAEEVERNISESEMSSVEGAESLDSLLYDATKASTTDIDATAVAKFWDAVNQDLDGPSNAARLLGHKIQSPQATESLKALHLTDECVKNCGRKFQDEVGKFRFLNEIIKMISPKYFGDRTSGKVKEKCIELLYRWSVELRHEPKILDAYEMLKRQGIIDDDPIINHDSTDADQPPITSTGDVSVTNIESAKPKDPSIFDDEDKSKLLARLLRSKHPDDLQAANRLIKNMVKQDEEKQEKLSQRFQLLETVKNNIKLLNEMLDCYQMAGGNSSSSDNDIIKELHQNIDSERPKLFKLASEAEEKDSDGMSKILSVNDDVVQIMARYKQVITDQVSKEGTEGNSAGKSSGSGDLLSMDLAGLDMNIPSKPTAGQILLAGLQPTATPKLGAQSGVTSLVGTSGGAFSLGGVQSGATSLVGAPGGAYSLGGMQSGGTSLVGTSGGAFPLGGLQSGATPLVGAQSGMTSPFSSAGQTSSLLSAPGSVPAATQNIFNSPVSAKSADSPATQPLNEKKTTDKYDSLLLGMDNDQQNAALDVPLLMPSSGEPVPSAFEAESPELLFDSRKAALDDLDMLGKDLLEKTKPAQQSIPIPNTEPSIPLVKPTLNQLKAKDGAAQQVAPQQVTSATKAEVKPLTDVFVPLESVKPGSKSSCTAYDKDGVKIVFHFAENVPREDVTVMVVSIMSCRSEPLRGVMFQVAVPKSMKVKLQPQSGSELPVYNPILPPSAITQVLLLANPAKDKVKLRYKLSYTVLSGPVITTGILSIAKTFWGDEDESS